MSFGRFPISYFGTSSAQISRTNVAGSVYSSSSEESVRSIRSVSAIYISSDSSSNNAGVASSHGASSVHRSGTTSDSSDSLDLQSSSSDQVIYRRNHRRQRRAPLIMSTESEVDEMESSSVASESDIQESQVPRSAAGVLLPVPLTLEEIGTILCWSRRVARVIPSDEEIFAIVYDRDSAVRFLMEQRILYDYDRDDMTRADMICDGGERMKFTYNVDRGYIWRCHKHGCVCGKSRVSALTGSFFEGLRLPLHRQIRILYYWLQGAPKTLIHGLTHVHMRTISSLISNFHQIMQYDFIVSEEDLDDDSDDDDAIDLEALPPNERHLHNKPNKIGGYDVNGEPIIVEIDESKFGKRKYHNGHRVEGVWVVGGVERTEERRVFLVSVPDRTVETMRAIIRRYVNRGTIICTDYWRSYLCIPGLRRNFVHRRVNHSEGYIAEDGTHTNTIEGTWFGIKLRCRPRERTKRSMPWVLLEFIWRRKYAGDLWGGFLKSLREVEYDRRQRDRPFLTELIAEDEEDEEEEEADEASSPILD